MTVDTAPDNDKHPKGFLAGSLWILYSFAAKEMTLSCTDRDINGRGKLLCEGKALSPALQLQQGEEHDPGYDLMSLATPEEGTKAAGVLSFGTDTAAITSIINHRSSKE